MRRPPRRQGCARGLEKPNRRLPVGHCATAGLPRRHNQRAFRAGRRRSRAQLHHRCRDLVPGQLQHPEGRLAHLMELTSAAFDGFATRFHGPGDPRPEGVHAAGAARRNESADRSGPRFYSRRRSPAIRRTKLTSCSDSSGPVRPLPRLRRRQGDYSPCSAQRVVGARFPRWSPMPMPQGRPCTHFTPAGERLRLPRTRKACSTSFVLSSKMGPGLSAREPSDFSRISNRVFLMERISSSRRRRHPGLRWHWRTRNRK